ncbi:hypothetical protein [Staphylococcus carnosus]|uniref:hypothetical protein n=1 Tax=Staphylococcus carnosus TaxID=1281 RepID=UPI000CD2C4E5|nr:hypothetical protein [Staphylococcus carnosus]PNZ96736.1 hypothetical protein CD153_12660 [Staphylococcus carnosus]QRQ05452.1 hypothetical protein I6J34_01925 [Staphylococcus carnosus]UTB82546.1 hypothetical protein A2I67_04200 [Staphylococcus carnosus]SUM06975.1 phage protein [Staphylococcus carnosus]GEP80683.1 hypothetical protein SCA05_24760 [Staphylococcus carnosus]
MKKSYKPPEISNGDLRVPVTFFRMVENEGPLPGSTQTDDVFTTLCEVYESSTKDLEKTSNITGTNKVTINFRNPHSDYRINHSDTFELIHDLYQDLTFRVIDFAPNSINKEIIKVVGVANDN